VTKKGKSGPKGKITLKQGLRNLGGKIGYVMQINICPTGGQVAEKNNF